MTTSNPPTAVEALIEARKALKCLFLAVDSCIASDVSMKVEQAFQALQLHGGGESRSDFASGSGDKELETERNYIAQAFADLQTAIRRDTTTSNPDFPNYGDCPITLPAGHWRAILAADQAQQYRRTLITDADRAWANDVAATLPEAHPILQGPTREEVARIIRSIKPKLYTDERGILSPGLGMDGVDEAIDSILALLNPTSPWRPIESAPENGTQIMVEYDDGQRVKVYWGRYDNGYSQTGVEGWVMGLSGKHPVRWTLLPALPGGENP